MANGSLAEWLTTGWGALWWSCQPCCVTFSWQWLSWHSQKHIRMQLLSHLFWTEFWVEKSHRPARSFHFQDCPGKRYDMVIWTQELCLHMHFGGVCKRSQEETFPVEKENKNCIALCSKYKREMQVYCENSKNYLFIDVFKQNIGCFKAFWNAFSNFNNALKLSSNVIKCQHRRVESNKPEDHLHFQAFSFILKPPLAAGRGIRKQQPTNTRCARW